MTNTQGWPGEIGSTVTVIMPGGSQLHCEEHFPAEVTTERIDDDGYAIMQCPTGHTIIEMT